MGKLEGKVAVITGGNSGIGLATAQRFVAEGASVYITGRRQSELDTAIRQIGKNVTAVQGDISKLADLDRRHAVVLIDDGNLQVLDVAAEGVAEHDKLDERHDHRHDDQHRTSFESPQFAFDNRQNAMHVTLAGS